MPDIPRDRWTPSSIPRGRSPQSPHDLWTPSPIGARQTPGSPHDQPISPAIRVHDTPTAPSSWRVTVRIDRVKQVDNLDRGSQADFKAGIVITGELRWRIRAYQLQSNESQLSTRWLPTVHGDDVSLGFLWQFSRTFEPQPELWVPTRAHIGIGLFERDHVWWMTLDRTCDINPLRGEKYLTIGYSREGGDVFVGHRAYGGQVGRRGQMFHVRGEGDSKRAEIWFTLT